MKKWLTYGSIGLFAPIRDYLGGGLVVDHPGRRPLVIEGHLPLGIG